MEMKEVLEILGCTYAEMCKACRKISKLEEENEMLRKELRKYENMERNDGNQPVGQ